MIFKKQSIGALLTTGLALAGCESPPPSAELKFQVPYAALSPKKEANPTVLKAFQLLREEKYKEASHLLNMVLQKYPKSTIYHLLNALTYEMLAEKGDETATDLAMIGYQNAIDLDHANLFAITQLGKLKYQAKEFAQAQELFANALLLKPKDPILLQEFAAASYYAYDLKAAYAAIKRAEKLKPDDPLIHRSAAMIYAALGDFETAKKHMTFFQSKMGKDMEVDRGMSRLDDWETFYQTKKVTLAAASGATPDTDEATKILTAPLGGGDAGAGGGTPAEKASGTEKVKQIILDCYLLSIVDQTSTSKGNNILENLAITLNPGNFTTYTSSMWGLGSEGASSVIADNVSVLGNSSSGASASAVPNPAFAAATVPVTLNKQGSITGQIFSAGISWAGLTYSLNIANAFDQRVELLSRPSLMTFLQKTSLFFSGITLVAGLSGQYGGNLVKYPIGTSIEVTPASLEGNMVTLNIGIENNVLPATGAPTQLFNSTVTVNSTRVDTFAKMQLGETLMLGGIYVRIDNAQKSQFPGLGDIPILQYFFSNETTGSFRQSIVFMITPRSPDAVRSAVNRAMARKSLSPHYKELKDRHPDWFHPNENMITIFKYLALDPSIYYEFRSGDITPPSWGWEATIPDKVNQLQSFLYY